MVGLFINTLPLRVKLKAEQPIAALLTQLQDSQSRLMAHQHVPVWAKIRAWLDWGELFDTLVVFLGTIAIDAAHLNKGRRRTAFHPPVNRARRLARLSAVSLAAVAGRAAAAGISSRPV